VVRIVVRLALACALAAGCTYGATFDDCQVRACRAPTDCPSGFTCDGDGFCRAPGATMSCAAVLGDANLGMDAKGDAANGPRCTGTATTCTALATNPTCVAQTGCGWVNPTCTVTTNCGMHMTNQACMTSPECMTDFQTSTCVKRPSYCSGATEAQCESKPVCLFAGGCTGTADACGAFTSQPSCNSQAGCSWQ
jgi:hypothetical protein